MQPMEVNLETLAQALKSAKNGDFSVRLPIEDNGLGEIAKDFNELMESQAKFAYEIIEISRKIGKEGNLDTRLNQETTNGIWTTSIDAINSLIENLIKPTQEAERVLSAIAQGDLSQKMALSLDNQPLNGNFIHLANSVNKLIDRLHILTTTVADLADENAIQGQINSQIAIEEASGIWQELINNINKISSKLPEQITNIADILLAVSQGNLSQGIIAANTGELQALTNSVNLMIDNMTNSLKQISEVATSVASAAEELTVVSREMSQTAAQTAEQATSVSASAEQVSQNTISIASAVEQMNVSIKEIAKNAAQGAKVATNAVKTANNTNETIAKLGQSSLEIGKVIKVITSIAQQTNLLALNATIEAARAGDAGRGFAVVAGEVKELAKQTAKATEDISQKIEAIQTDTQSAVAAITEISVVINDINDIQNTIASAVEEQTATTNEISRNISETAKTTADIARNIGMVAINSQNNTAAAGNTSAAATELSRMAVELHKVVSQFKY